MREMRVDWSSAINKLLDPYDIKARLFPGLLVLFPAILYLALIYGAKNPVVAGLSAVLMACGGPYLLSSFVRTWGQHAQERLYRQWGAQPSTILMRHRDGTLPGPTKQRYRELVASRLGLELPGQGEEQRDPTAADMAYAAAADALRPLTNDHKAFPFVFKELVAYGFNRNAHGSRWLGVGVALATVLVTLIQGSALSLQQPFLALGALDNAHIVVLLSAFVMVVLWSAHFTGSTVKLAGISYAKRLWEALDQLPKKSHRARPKATEPAT
ncbi:MAG TPA: hypothetical protein PK306_16610 [Aquabacterium sp.]|nr:hypothetical protein [Aquabacterium sp.]